MRYCFVGTAGTGKTTALIREVVKAIENGMNPQEITVLTFSRAAARNFLRRADDLTRGAFVGTMHSWALNLLRRFASYLRLPRGFNVDTPERIENARPYIRACLSFDELITIANDTLQHLLVARDYVRQTARLLVVDEIHDYDTPQLRLLTTLMELAKDFIAAYDKQQTIYTFRGAAPEEVEATLYRAGVEFVPLETAHRFERDPESLPPLRVFADREAEGRYLAETAFRQEGTTAILTRTRQAAAQLSRFFPPDGFLNAAGRYSLLTHKGVRALLAPLRLAVNPWDYIACLDFGAIAAVDANEVAVTAMNKGTHYAAALTTLLRLRISEEAAVSFERVRRATNASEALNNAYALTVQTGRADKRWQAEEGAVRFTDALQHTAADWEQWRVQDFLAWLVSPDFEGDEARYPVVLSTIHAAKGKEWDNVFVAACDRFAPHKESDLDEERRVFYVACTRARRRLFLTAAGSSVPSFLPIKEIENANT